MAQSFIITINFFYHEWQVKVAGVYPLYRMLDKLMALYGKDALTVELA